MARVGGILLAVVAGAAAALLPVWGATAQVDGREVTCAGIVATAEGGSRYDDSRIARACDQVQDRWKAYAVAAAVVCLVAGTGVVFRQPKDRAGTGTRWMSIEHGQAMGGTSRGRPRDLPRPFTATVSDPWRP